MTSRSRTPLYLMFLLALVGCQERIPEWELKSMTAKCETHGGISYIDNFVASGARCRDGIWTFPEKPE